MVSQIVWDMDGTIVDSTSVVPDSFIDAVRELGGPDVERGEVVAAYSLGVPEVMLAHLLGRPLEAGEEDAYYSRLTRATVSPYPGVIDTLNELRRVEHPIVVFTGASSRAAEMLLRSAEVPVDLLIGGDQVGRPKPAPDGLLFIARELGVPPQDLAYIGDAPTDLLTAQSAGSLSVAAKWGHLYDPNSNPAYALDAPSGALALLSPTKM